MHVELDALDMQNKERLNNLLNNGNFQELIIEMKRLDYLYEYQFNFHSKNQVTNTIVIET